MFQNMGGYLDLGSMKDSRKGASMNYYDYMWNSVRQK